MNDISFERRELRRTTPIKKFTDPDTTANGQKRASVALERLETLWINTGTLCNIECVNCYIESSPSNDRLAYISADETASFLDEISDLSLNTREIGFTGGEPFMNPDMLAMTADALGRGYEVLILTNAMQPMLRKRIKEGLLALREQYGSLLTLRVSLDHYSQKLHETERGPNTWLRALEGLDWLSENGFRLAIAGRTCWNENEVSSRAGYAKLIADRGWSIDPDNPHELVLLPEMDELADVPEITDSCWSLLGIHPREVMCATSRMVVKRKGDSSAKVLPCTLLPYDRVFEMGNTLAESLSKNGGMFKQGAVKLCHPHCSKFCVLGGGSCSG